LLFTKKHKYKIVALVITVNADIGLECIVQTDEIKSSKLLVQLTKNSKEQQMY